MAPGPADNASATGRAAEIAVHWPAGAHYDCVSCGRSCAGWRIAVEPEVAERVARLPMTLRIIEERGAAFETTPDGGLAMHQGAHAACGFLQPDHLCGIHARLGAQAKPTVCQQHPFQLLQTPDGVHVGLSFQCTSVRDNSGRSIEAHEEWLRGLLDRGSCITQVDPHHIPFRSGLALDWAAYTAFESELQHNIDELGWDAALADAIEVSAQAQRAGDVLLSGGKAGDTVRQLLVSIPFGLIKLQLRELTPARTLALDEAFMTGDTLHFPEWRWRGTWARLCAVPLSAEAEAELDRWKAMQLHRRALLVGRPVLANLWGLALLPRTLRLLTALEGGGRAAYLRALDWCECHLGANGNLLDRYADTLTAALEAQLAAVRNEDLR